MVEVFKNILKDKKLLLQANEGTQFEDNLTNKFKNGGFSFSNGKQNFKNNINVDSKTFKTKFEELKLNILNKTSMEIYDNPFPGVERHVVFQPFGKQNYPDFLFFYNKKIIPVEVKYTKLKSTNVSLGSSRPMWNSNLPKDNAIYIYGVSGKDLTFFKGSDILQMRTRQLLVNFWENGVSDDYVEQFDVMLSKYENNFGLYPYIRKAYEHKLKKSTFFWDNGKKQVQGVESYFSEKRTERESGVIEFLKKLETIR